MRDRDDRTDPRWVSPELEVWQYLGGGGTSRVYEGYDHARGQAVAIKIARGGLDARTKQRFAREVSALEAVRHPNIVGVLGHGTLPEGRPYVVMQRVRGRPLHDLLLERGGRLRWQEAIPIALVLLDALGAMHRAGMVHRDVKPANVLVTDHGPVLVDLGFTALPDGGPPLTPDGRVVGTPGFIPPELLLGRSEVMPSADVYAVGVLLFQMLVGKPPFSGTLSEMIVQIMSGPRPDPSLTVAALPRPVGQLVARAMARDPRRRFSDADSMAAALREVVVMLATEPG